MKTLIKFALGTGTVLIFLYNIGILHSVLDFILAMFILFAALAIPFGLLTNLFAPSGSRRQYFSRNDYTE